MSQSPATPSPQLYFDTINAFQKTAALKAAIDLGLFSAIGSRPSTSAEIATRCECPERGIRILCDYLTILGFLAKDGSHYALTQDSSLFLDRHSPAYLGRSADFLLAPQLVEAFHDLAPTIRRGAPALTSTTPDHPMWLDFARTMGPMMVGPARGIAELVPLDAHRKTKVLDISASHGAYGLAFAQKNPRAHLVALDWEPVLAITEENARAVGIAERFSKIAGDAFAVDLGHDYDVVLVPNFLHHFNPADCTRFLRRVQAALRPGGRVVIVDFVPNEDRVSPPASAGFGLVMLSSTAEGDVYTFAEYSAMLKDAGFQGFAFRPLLPTAASAVIATK
ncbi:MAG: methyltransferase [Chthoniobacter sp.]|uniref:methyltransferase n=1 Tax=Chthoniobacter sp. TaxID=2510640 RepID=UPI0032A3D5D4